MIQEGSSRHRAYACVAVFVLATAVAAWVVSPYLVGVFHDDGVYALLARSLASGQGFHYSHLPGTPAAVHYPPMYPLFLSVLWRIWPTFPDNVMPLLYANAVLVGVAALGWWTFATRRLGWNAWTAAAGAVVATLMLPTLALASALLSETLFLAALWPSLILAEDAVTIGSPASAVRAGVSIGLLMLVRTHAVALLLALIVMAVVRKMSRVAVIGVAVAAAIQLPWILWSATATPHVTPALEGSYGSYLGWFATGIREGNVPFVVATMAINVRESWLHVNDRLAAGFPLVVQAIVIVAAVAALALGMRSLWKRVPVTTLFLVSYFGIMAVWPYTPWRFIWAVWPLVMLVGFEGARAALAAPWPRARPSIIAASLLLSAALLRNDLHAYAHREWRIPGQSAARELEPVLAWIHASVPSGDIVLSEGEQSIALYDGNTAAPPVSFTALQYVVPRPASEGAVQLREMMKAVPARWVILMDRGMMVAADSMASVHPGLVRVAQLRGAVVYQVVQ